MAAAWSEYGKYNCIRTWSEVPTSTVWLTEVINASI